MEEFEKAFELFWQMYNSLEWFKKFVDENVSEGKIRFFNATEFNKITSQNFISLNPAWENFIDMFLLGDNIGNCVGSSIQLSYSYDDVDIVSGILPMLKGTKNAEKEGGHCWLEDSNTIIDTSLMLVIDKTLKKDLGYIEEQRITARDLRKAPLYQSRKDFVNDVSLKK